MVGLIPTEHKPSRPPCVMLLPKTKLIYATQSTMCTKMAAMDYGPSNNRDLVYHLTDDTHTCSQILNTVYSQYNSISV